MSNASLSCVFSAGRSMWYGHCGMVQLYIELEVVRDGLIISGNEADCRTGIPLNRLKANSGHLRAQEQPNAYESKFFVKGPQTDEALERYNYAGELDKLLQASEKSNQCYYTPYSTV